MGLLEVDDQARIIRMGALICIAVSGCSTGIYRERVSLGCAPVYDAGAGFKFY